jgi:hypothetical protein
MNQAGNVKTFNSYIPKANSVVNAGLNQVSNAVSNGLSKVGNAMSNGFNTANKALNAGINGASKLVNVGMNNAVKSLNSSVGAVNNMAASVASNAIPGNGSSIWATVGIWLLILLIAAVGVLIFFYNEIMETMPDDVQEFGRKVRRYLGIEGPAPAAPAPAVTPVAAPPAPPAPVTGSGDGLSIGNVLNIPADIAGAIEKQLPGQKKMEVFNIKENKYTYDDAEPLCKALGAELATYDQVKDAWNKGADWCSYGWVKGQMAVYPTQEETYDKLQKGPPSQRNACGKVGVNGGFFDNPDLKFGVNCYGMKPAQKGHDSTLLPSGEAYPYDPDAIEFDKKVALFKADVEHIGVLPFKPGDWSEF